MGFRAAYEGILPPDYLTNLDPTKKARQWKTGLIVNPEIVRKCAREKGKLTGVAAAAPLSGSDGASSELLLIYVHPEWQRRGIGGKLLGAVLSMVKTPVRVWVLSENITAQNFYVGHGFIPEDLVKQVKYSGKFLTEIALRKY